jgi:hypothetical protein
MMTNIQKIKVAASLVAVIVLVCAAPARAASARVAVRATFIHAPSLVDLRQAKSEEVTNPAQLSRLNVKGQPVLASLKSGLNSGVKKIEYDFE